TRILFEKGKIEMIKNIIREVEPECAELSFYFDDDGLSAAGGDYCYTLFIVDCDRFGRYSGLNVEEYNNVRQQAEAIIDGFDDVKTGCRDYDGNRITYKDIMIDNDIPYNSRKCNRMKAWAENADIDRTEDIAEFLSITTGKTWDTTSASGYCQGDYVEMVFCVDHYTEKSARAYGEVWLGCAKEFCVIDLEEDGNEGDTVYGFIVADCEAWREEDYKKLVCSWACISEAETALQMIDWDVHSYRGHTYKMIMPDGTEVDEEDFKEMITAA
ncbi:MAG: hypothetical protein IKM73_00065, partial [Acidaminococcaceae bacterium]|nr:hypothetical protein [Acidaminococcaceae bacterium]